MLQSAYLAGPVSAVGRPLASLSPAMLHALSRLEQGWEIVVDPAPGGFGVRIQSKDFESEGCNSHTFEALRRRGRLVVVHHDLGRTRWALPDWMKP